MSEHPRRQPWMLSDTTTNPPIINQSINQSISDKHEIGGIWATTRHDQSLNEVVTNHLHPHVKHIDPAIISESTNLSFMSSPSPDSPKNWRDRMREKRQAQSTDQSINQSAEVPVQRFSQSHSINPTRFAGLSNQSISENASINQKTPNTSASSQSKPIDQHANQSISQPANQPINQLMSKADYQKELNRLTARAMKAKLSKKLDQHNQLTEEINQWKLKYEQSISQVSIHSVSQPISQPAKPIPQLSKNEHDHVHDNVVILDQLDKYGRPYHYSTNQETNQSSNQSTSQEHKRRRHVSKLDQNGQRLGYLEADLFDRFDQLVARPPSQSTNQSLNQSIKRDLINERLSNQSVDDVYVQNLLKRPKRAINQSIKQSIDQDEHFDALDDDLGLYEDKKAIKNSSSQAINQAQIRSTAHYNRLVDSCAYCIGSRANKQSTNQSIIATGQYWYLALPPVDQSINQSNSQFPHLILAAVEHCPSQSSIDQTYQSELNEWKHRLITLFNQSINQTSQPINQSTNQSSQSTSQSAVQPSHQRAQPVFVETFLNVERDHCMIDCFVIPSSMTAEAPLFFTQSISQLMDEISDSEPRNLIDIKPIRSIEQSTNQSISQLVPPRFSYVSVEFGNTGGFIQSVDSSSNQSINQIPRKFGQQVVDELIEQYEQSTNQSINQSTRQFDMVDKQLTPQQIKQQRIQLIADLKIRLDSLIG